MTNAGDGGAPGAETPGIGAPGAPVRERRMTARREHEAVLRVLRREPLELVATDRGGPCGDAVESAGS